MATEEKDKFNVENQYQLYLERVKLLPENKMHPEQRLQLRQTFYAAVGQLLLLLRDDLPVEDEDAAIEIMADMFQQVSDYFTNR